MQLFSQQYNLVLIKCFYTIFSRLTAASYVSFARAAHRRYEFRVALRAEVSSASIRIISFLPLLSMETFDLDVAGFLVSGIKAFNKISNCFFEASSKWITAFLFISVSSKLGERLLFVDRLLFFVLHV